MEDVIDGCEDLVGTFRRVVLSMLDAHYLVWLVVF